MIVCVSPRCLNTILSTIVLALVLVSWGFVIYGARVAAQWELEKRASTKV